MIGNITLLLLALTSCVPLETPYTAAADIGWVNESKFLSSLDCVEIAPDAFACDYENYTLFINSTYIQMAVPCIQERIDTMKIKPTSNISCFSGDVCVKVGNKSYYRFTAPTGEEIEMILISDKIVDFKVRGDPKKISEILEKRGFRVTLAGCKEKPIIHLDARKKLKELLKNLITEGVIWRYRLLEPKYSICGLKSLKGNSKVYGDDKKHMSWNIDTSNMIWIAGSFITLAGFYFVYKKLSRFR